MKRLLIAAAFCLLAGVSAKAQVNTFCASNLPCTVTGAWSLTGLVNLDNIRYVDPANKAGLSGTDLAGWIASAFASLPQQSGTVIVTGGASYATPSASITVGVSPCTGAPSNGWSQTLILDNVQVTINNPIKVLCSGFVSTSGQNSVGSLITAGASLGTNPMIDVGDGTNNVNAGVSFVRLNCASQAGCTGIRARGIQDYSVLNYNIVQNYLVNGINIDCSTAGGGGNFTVRGNFLGAATGASDALVLNACNGAIVEKNSGVSNSGAAISAASLSIKGNTNNQECIIVHNNHSEKHTDNASIDSAACVILEGLDSSNSTTNTVHVKATATGSVLAFSSHNNGSSNSFPVILNDVTTTNLSSNNPPAPNGVIPEYGWMNGTFEYWRDSNGRHELQKWGIGGTTFFTPAAQLHVKSNASNLNGFEIDDIEASGKNIFFGPGVKAVGRVSLLDASDASVELLDCNLVAGGGCNIRQGGLAVAGGITPEVAGVGDLGSTALPHGNLWLGTAATNNFKFAPAATAAARIINIPDPLGTTSLPLTIFSGTKALNTASVTTATCDAGAAAAAAGTLSTDTVDWSFNAAPTATNKYGAFLVVYAVPSANTVTFYTCNPSATTSTPTAMTVNFSVRRP